MKNFFLIFCVFIFSFRSVYSQDIIYLRSIIDTLCMQDMYGRGYVNDGEKKAADYIARQLKKLNTQHFGDDYFQPFTISINTLPGDLELKINDKLLMPGVDYTVDPDAPNVDTSYVAYSFLNNKTLCSQRTVQNFYNKEFKEKLIIIDTGFEKNDSEKLLEAEVVMRINYNKNIWRVSRAQKQNHQAIINISNKALPKKIKKAEIKVHAKFEETYSIQNVVGYFPGKVYPDTFIIVGAHFDHLGMMGNKTYFPGANDNASGTAMVLDLARFFADTAHIGKYSIAFMFFTGEEAGLLGSEYYTKNPLFPLSNIKFMLNLDMIGTGSNGIKVVNGSVIKKEFERLKSINEQHGYLKTVSERGEAANSDHYFFYKKGVKSFFIYTLGNEYKEYHTPTDKAEGLPLTKYNELFKLIVDFIKSF
ncbi:MAG: M28 family peptidase [Bacteroidales bacterium]|nr:M28 family peptidase [Bacteroidales bacterium]